MDILQTEEFPGVSGVADPDEGAAIETSLMGGEARQQQSQPFDFIYGTWLDPCLCLRGNAGAELVQFVLDEIGTPRRSDHRQNFEFLVECILANGLRANFFRETAWVAYRRRHGARWGQPSWASGDSQSARVDRLIEVGLLEGYRGVRGGPSSTFCITPELIGIAAYCGVAAEHIGSRTPDPRGLIILRSGGDKKKAKKGPIRYDPTDETRDWAEKLDRYNRLIEQHDIALKLNDEEKAEFIEKAHEKRSHWNLQPKMVEPEFFRRHLFRIFNDGTWDHGGRFYRAWWQVCPRSLRPKIKIDGESTIELDYSGFLPRSLYHLHGDPYPDDDNPYQIDELVAHAVELGNPPDYFLKSTKKLLVALLNGDKEDGHPEKIRLKQSFLPTFSRREVEGLIANKHPLLAGMFRTGVGKRNQRLESDIAFEIMMDFTNDGIPILPIHDSFIVGEAHRDRLMNRMIAAYETRLGHAPVIKEAGKT